MSDENVIFMDFFAVKVDGSDVIAEISLYENLFTDSRYDITSVNFNSEKVHEITLSSDEQHSSHIGRKVVLWLQLRRAGIEPSPRHVLYYSLVTNTL